MLDFSFFEAVAAALAVAAPVAQNLGMIAKGGRNLWDFADRIYERFVKRVPPEQVQVVLRKELTQAAALPQLEFDKKVDQLVEVVLKEQPPEERKAAAEYIKLMPARIRTTFVREEDRSGTSVPNNWIARGAEDIASFLPPRPPLFKVGDSPPQAPSWVLTERLGIGGFGEVWKARGKTMQNTFTAFKFCLDPQSQKSILENELKNIELVQNELGNQPNIVKLLDAHLDGDTPWLRYQYVPGGDLGQLLATWANDPVVRAAMAVEKIRILADTLAHCHQGFMVDGKRLAVIHRDMKPANVLVDKDGVLKITDFGIGNTQARQALDEARLATVSGMTVSTPAAVRWANTPLYASPQQKDGLHPHASDDVHSLGVMLYQMILGNINRALFHDYREVLERKHICPQLVEIVVRSTASDLSDRYQHAGELAEALRKLPKKLIAEPVVVSPAEEKKQLTDKVDAWYADADAKNEAAEGHLERREWAAAVKLLETIPHRRMIKASIYNRAIAHRDGKRFLNALGMEFAIVPAGTFWMGGGNGTCGDKQVKIERDFYLGVYPVTQEEWHKVMGTTPSHFRKGGDGADKLTGVPDADLKHFPVENVSWNDCQQFAQKLNEKTKESGWLYRLPQEAEWEYACRGAATSKADCSWSYYFRTPTNTLSPQQANYSDSALGRTSRVGLYQPNALGLYDMHGNVWEWCEDAYELDKDEAHCMFRGGGWYDSDESSAAACGDGGSPYYADSDLGLRLV